MSLVSPGEEKSDSALHYSFQKARHTHLVNNHYFTASSTGTSNSEYSKDGTDLSGESKVNFGYNSTMTSMAYHPVNHQLNKLQPYAVNGISLASPNVELLHSGSSYHGEYLYIYGTSYKTQHYFSRFDSTDMYKCCQFQTREL